VQTQSAGTIVIISVSRSRRKHLWQIPKCDAEVTCLRNTLGGLRFFNSRVDRCHLLTINAYLHYICNLIYLGVSFLCITLTEMQSE
jgi:hypothetical protein